MRPGNGRNVSCILCVCSGWLCTTSRSIFLRRCGSLIDHSIHALDPNSDQVHLSSLFMLHMSGQCISVHLQIHFVLVMSGPQYTPTMLPLLPLLQWFHLLWKNLHGLLYAISQKIMPPLMVVDKKPGLDLPRSPRLFYNTSNTKKLCCTLFTPCMHTYPTIPISTSVTAGVDLSSLLANLTTCKKQNDSRSLTCMTQAAKVQDSRKSSLFLRPIYFSSSSWSII